MKIKIAFILFLLVPLVSFGQLNSSIDFITGIEYSYRSLNMDPDSSSLPFNIIDLRNNRESGKANWRIGINYNKRLSNRFYLKTGLRLASVGYKGEKQTDLRWPSEIGPWGYQYDPSLPHEMQLIYDYWFLEIPLAGRYVFLDKKFSPFIEVGISPSYYLTTKTKTITDIGNSTSFSRGGNSPFTNLHLVGVLSLGSNFTVNEKMQLFGQATYRRHLSKLVNASIKEYLYNIGMELGLRWKIN